MRLLFTALLLTLAACGGTQEGDADLKAKELELKERELALKEKEAELAEAAIEEVEEEEEKGKTIEEELKAESTEYGRVQDLIKKEKENRLDLVKLSKERLRVNGWGNTVINFYIHNNAKLVTFNDYEITVDYLDGAGKKIGEDKFWVDLEIKPNSKRPHEKRITGKKEGAEFHNIKITDVKY